MDTIAVRRRFREQTARFDVDPVAYEFAGMRSIAEVGLLSALQATARYIQAQDFRVYMRETARRSGCGDSVADAPPFTVHRILGTAVAADTVAYVLHDDGLFASDSVRTMTMDPMVMQLRLRGGSWRILPGPTLLRRSGMAFGSMGCDSTGRRPPG